MLRYAQHDIGELGFLVKNLEHAIFTYTEFAETVQRARRWSAQHFAGRIELGIMTRAEERVRFILPVDRASQMGTAAVQDEQIFGIFRFADDKSTMTGGGPLPTINLDACECEGCWL